jgi:hypothetical protein
MMDISTTSTKQSSVLATGMLITVSYLLISCVNTFLEYDQFVTMPTALVWEAFFWLMGKCMFSLTLDPKKMH